MNWKKTPKGEMGIVAQDFKNDRKFNDTNIIPVDTVVLIHKEHLNSKDVEVHVLVNGKNSAGKFEGEITGFEPIATVGSITEYQDLHIEQIVTFEENDVHYLHHGPAFISP